MSRPSWLNDILCRYKKVVIAGVPRSGKTTLSRTVNDRPVFSTDSYRESWEDAPHTIMDAIKDLDSYLLEGIQVGRCLRKGLKPDVVIWMQYPKIELKPGQKTMAKGCMKIFNDWLSGKPSTIPVVTVLHNQ